MSDMNQNPDDLTMSNIDDVSEAERRYKLIHNLAIVCAKSSMVPRYYRDNVNDAFVAIQMGAELGLPPFQAIQFIAPIYSEKNDECRPTLWGDGLLAVVRGSKVCEYVREWLSDDGQEAFCETKRKGEPEPVVRSYTMDRARANGLLGKPIWRKDPQRMLQMRARGFCLRDVYADILKGVGMAEEVMDYDAPVPPQDVPEHKDPVEEAAPIVEEDTTLDDVLDDIKDAKSMADLLKAGDAAKRLSEEDRGKARDAYATKRTELKENQKGNDDA